MTACGQSDYTPKPRIYPKVVFPQRTYQAFDESYCSFTFQQPIYTTIEQDQQYFEENTKDDCWFDVVYPDFNGRIHFTYQPIVAKDSLYKAINDANELAFKHTMRADYIDPFVIYNPNNQVYGEIFEIGGRVASPFQFYVTDSANHFLRGSLYFNNRPEPDSMRPVIEFVKEDIVAILNSFEWVN